jgi:hypothetical protein
MNLENGPMTLTKPDPSKMLARFLPTIVEAVSLQVVDTKTANRAGELLKEIKGGERVLLEGDQESGWEGFNEPTDAAFKAHKFLTKLRTMATDPYTQAYQTLNGRLLVWESAQRQKAADEARAREEAARREAEELKIREAVHEEEQGNKGLAAEILAEPVVAPTFIPEAAPKIEGRSVTVQYSAVCTDILKLAKYVVEHPEDANLLEPNMVAINQRARSQKKGFTLAGCALQTKDIARTARG